LGHRQAKALAAEPIDALYSSASLRCRQTLEPLAQRLGKGITALPELAKGVSSLPLGWERRSGSNGHRGAHAAGSLFRAVERIRREHPEGRAVVCAHLRTITSLTSFLVAAHRLPELRELSRHGQWYRMRFADDTLAIDLVELPGFPR
jgi:broad specificity phosphatase PhoE